MRKYRRGRVKLMKRKNKKYFKKYENNMTIDELKTPSF